MTHVAVRTREHVAGVPAHSTLELVEYAIIFVEITKLREKWAEYGQRGERKPLYIVVVGNRYTKCSP